MDLRTARKACNFTQQELADVIGVSHVTISNYETGRMMPTQENQQRIEQILDTSIDWQKTALSAYTDVIKDALIEALHDYFEYVERYQQQPPDDAEALEHPFQIDRKREARKKGKK